MRMKFFYNRIKLFYTNHDPMFVHQHLPDPRKEKYDLRSQKLLNDIFIHQNRIITCRSNKFTYWKKRLILQQMYLLYEYHQ